jgi:hypothetical protein
VADDDPRSVRPAPGHGPRPGLPGPCRDAALAAAGEATLAPPALTGPRGHDAVSTRPAVISAPRRAAWTSAVKRRIPGWRPATHDVVKDKPRPGGQAPGDKSAEDPLELHGDRKELLTWQTEALKERTWRRQAA